MNRLLSRLLSLSLTLVMLALSVNLVWQSLTLAKLRDQVAAMEGRLGSAEPPDPHKIWIKLVESSSENCVWRLYMPPINEYCLSQVTPAPDGKLAGGMHRIRAMLHRTSEYSSPAETTTEKLLVDDVAYKVNLPVYFILDPDVTEPSTAGLGEQLPLLTTPREVSGSKPTVKHWVEAKKTKPAFGWARTARRSGERLAGKWGQEDIENKFPHWINLPAHIFLPIEFGAEVCANRIELSDDAVIMTIAKQLSPPWLALQPACGYDLNKTTCVWLGPTASRSREWLAGKWGQEDRKQIYPSAQSSCPHFPAN